MRYVHPDDADVPSIASAVPQSRKTFGVTTVFTTIVSGWARASNRIRGSSLKLERTLAFDCYGKISGGFWLRSKHLTASCQEYAGAGHLRNSDR